MYILLTARKATEEMTRSVRSHIRKRCRSLVRQVPRYMYAPEASHQPVAVDDEIERQRGQNTPVSEERSSKRRQHTKHTSRNAMLNHMPRFVAERHSPRRHGSIRVSFIPRSPMVLGIIMLGESTSNVTSSFAATPVVSAPPTSPPNNHSTPRTPPPDDAHYTA